MNHRKERMKPAAPVNPTDCIKNMRQIIDVHNRKAMPVIWNMGRLKSAEITI